MRCDRSKHESISILLDEFIRLREEHNIEKSGADSVMCVPGILPYLPVEDGHSTFCTISDLSGAPSHKPQPTPSYNKLTSNTTS